MIVSILTGGSRGDVQPYLALGKRLRQAGHSVRLIASDDFELFVTEAGLTFYSTGFNVEAVVQSDEWRAVTERGNFLAIVSKMRATMKGQARMIAERLPDYLQGSDLIVAGAAGLGGGFSTAEKLGIPMIQAYLFPLTPTRAFPGPIATGLPFGSVLNPLSSEITRLMLWQSTRSADVEMRRILGMPGASFWGPFRHLERDQVPVLYGYSRHVLPVPDDWQTHHHVTGYWFLDPDAEWRPPADLIDFLEAGEPPIYIGFGSMGNRNPREAGEIALKALRLAGQRGILAAGWGGLSPADAPDTVYMMSSLPHSWLFPRVAAVVHHGGAGTTAAGLRAGVPSVVIPFMGDQPFWGQRIADLGVGPQPIPRKKLTAEALAAAIKETVHDAAMRQRASDLGERIREENGVDSALAIIEQSASQQPHALTRAL